MVAVLLYTTIIKIGAQRPQRSLFAQPNDSTQYTAIPYRASTGPEQGFPCVVFTHREKPVFIAGFPVDENRFFSVGNTTQGWVCSVERYIVIKIDVLDPKYATGKCWKCSQMAEVVSRQGSRSSAHK